MEKFEIESEMIKIINYYKEVCLERCNPFLKKQLSDNLEFMKDFVRGWFAGEEIKDMNLQTVSTSTLPSNKENKVITFPDNR